MLYMTTMPQPNYVSPLRGVGAERRWRVGSATVARVAQTIAEAVPERVAIYPNAVIMDECGDAPPGDVDLVAVTKRGLFVIAVTGTRDGTFGRQQNKLTGHPGASRQVRQLEHSVRQLAASAVGRLATSGGVPVIPLLVLEGDMSSALRKRPWFDLESPPFVARGIQVIGARDVGGYVRGRLAHGTCRAEVQKAIEGSLEKAVLARWDDQLRPTPTDSYRRAG